MAELAYIITAKRKYNFLTEVQDSYQDESQWYLAFFDTTEWTKQNKHKDNAGST